MTRWRSGYASVEIDISEHLEEVPTEDLLQELQEREIEGPDCYDRDYAERALTALIGGRPSEALALLDRALNPWPPSNIAEKEMQKFRKLI